MTTTFIVEPDDYSYDRFKTAKLEYGVVIVDVAELAEYRAECEALAKSRVDRQTAHEAQGMHSFTTEDLMALIASYPDTDDWTPVGKLPKFTLTNAIKLIRGWWRWNGDEFKDRHAEFDAFRVAFPQLTAFDAKQCFGVYK